MDNQVKIELADTCSGREILKKKYSSMDFQGRWRESFGKPALSGCWLIWAQSASGKTTFTIRLAKYLAKFFRVYYNSLEEGFKPSFQSALRLNHIEEVEGKLKFARGDTLEQLKARLRKRGSAKIVIIDSWMYLDANFEDYKALRREFPSKLFIIICHNDPKNPKEPYSTVTQNIRRDADVKVYIEGFKAFVRSRFGGDAPFIIWEKGAKNYWGK